MEIPHFAALRGTERELVILRSETGESWREHHCDYTEEELNQILNGMDEGKGSVVQSLCYWMDDSRDSRCFIVTVVVQVWLGGSITESIYKLGYAHHPPQPLAALTGTAAVAGGESSLSAGSLWFTVDIHEDLGPQAKSL